MADVPFNNTNIKPSDISLLDIVKAIKNGTEYETRFTNLNDFFSDNITITFGQVNGDPYTNEELGEILTELARQILVNRNEIINTKHLVALVTFELLEQGIEVDGKELLENLQIYLKK